MSAENKTCLFFNTITFLKEIFAKYGRENLALSFNGGKDCTVLLELIRLAGCPSSLKIIYFEQENEFKEITSFIKETETKYGLKMITIREPTFKEGIEELFKTTPLKGILMGQRMGDPYTNSLTPFIQPSSEDWPLFDRINPLLNWSYKNVWDFLLTFNIPYCSLYSQGYTSIGNTKNTSPNPHLYNSSTQKHDHACKLEEEKWERSGREEI